MIRRILLASLAVSLLAGCDRAGLLPTGLEARRGGGEAEATGGPGLSFVANQAYLAALDAMLSAPDVKTVDILHYNFFTEHGGAPQQILDRLKGLAARGVRVRVMLEGVRGRDSADGAASRNTATLDKLRAAGITEVKLSGPHTTHDKVVCVNGSRLLMGSTNWTKTSIEKNNETNALISSPKLGQAFVRYYEALWAGSAVMLPGLTQDGDTALLTDSRFHPELLKLIDRAERSLDIATYLLGYRKGREDRDVKVREVLDHVIARHKALKAQGKPFSVRFFLDNNGIPSKSRDYYQEYTINAAVHAQQYLAAGGVSEVYFDKFEQISHCKFVIKDARLSPEERRSGDFQPEVLFGSTNLDGGDFDRHHQLNVLTTDAMLAGAFTRYMDDRLETATPTPKRPTGPGPADQVGELD